MTPQTLTDLVQCVLSAQATLRTAEDILATQEGGVSREQVTETLDNIDTEAAAGLVPDHVQEWIVEECLRNGCVDTDEAIDAIGADDLIDRLQSRGDLEYPDADSLAEIAGAIRDLRYADLEDVIDEANEIANRLESLIP